VAAVIGLGSAPVGALAVDGSVPFVLPGRTLVAVTGDIDDDGAREVVRITGEPASMVIEAWGLVDGAWVMTLATDLQPFVAPGTVTIDGAAPVALVRTRVSGDERLLILAAGYDQERGTPSCCFTVHEILDRGAGPEIRALPAPDVEAESVVVVDVDGDGTDELAATRVQWSEDGNAGSTSLNLIRRDGDRLSVIAAWRDDGAWWVMPPVESDGVPGGELILSGETTEVVRLTWADGLLEVRSQLEFDGQPSWITGAVSGALVVMRPDGLALVDWPAGEELTVTARYETRDFAAVGVVGTGRDALFVIQDYDAQGAPADVIRVLDARFEPVGEVRTAPEAVELWERLYRGDWNTQRSIWPYAGPGDGEWSDAARSYVIGGMEISAGPAGTFEARRTRSLVGQRIGAAGADDAWVALGDGFFSAGPVAHLSAGFFGVEPRLTLVPLALLRLPIEGALATSVSFDRAIETGRTDDAVTLLAAPTGAEIVVTVPPGTVALSSRGSATEEHATRDGLVRLSLTPPRRPPPDRLASFETELMLIGPVGDVSFHRWEGAFAPEAPDLTAWTRADPLSLEATVAGRTTGATVTVDGREVSVNQSGAYRAAVSAPPWPRTVVVVARDPFGGEQRTTVEVIGLVDYRGLPWMPIAGVATVLGGAVLFLRTPRHRPLAERPVLDDGQLEDLDGDLT
jgi:hypothetical protein